MRVDGVRMIKYIGSKRTLIPEILRVVEGLDGVGSVLDLFSGTARVGHALKGRGFRVTSNDNLAFAQTLARCYVKADRSRILDEVTEVLDDLQAQPGKPGWFTETYCHKSRFFQPQNGARVDAIRNRLARMELAQDIEAVCLVSLMEAVDRVDSTCGVQMAYLKSWAPRAHKDMALRVPDFLEGEGDVLGMEASEAARCGRFDLVYLDPPYNQHKYLGNYHIWESLVLWDKPEVYGVACKRVDCRERKSPFNSKRAFLPAFQEVLDGLEARYLLVSFSNEGFVDRAEMEEILGRRGSVEVRAIDYKRYVGAQIGIHNPAGEKVGEVSHTRNKEFLYLVECR